MREEQLDLWDTPADAKCITTNGYIKTNGELVMGAGVAGQAQARYPRFPKIAGDFVNTYGNIVGIFTAEHLLSEYKPWKQHEYFITFPVKHVWYEDADLTLIERSSHELMDALNEPGFKSWKKILLPRPGCGNGHLKWKDVKPVIEPILDDRVIVIYA